MSTDTIMQIQGLKKYFPVQSTIRMEPRSVKAIDDVSFDIYRGETFGLVGESGCGKSTTGRCAIGLMKSTAGQIIFNGKDIAQLSSKERKAYTSKMQMIFQDPSSSLNPRMRIGSIVEEPLKLHHIGKDKAERRALAMNILEKVGIRSDQYYRFPHEFSGGQKQRIGIARSLILNPELIVCDEAVSALDVSIQSQILNLLAAMKKELNITYLFISHNISVVRYVSDRIGVMYLGHLVELAPTDEIFSNPIHPYTRALLSAVPEINPHIQKEQILLEGDIPSPIDPPSGCVFHNRCPYARMICSEKKPKFEERGEGHYVSCLLKHFKKKVKK